MLKVFVLVTIIYIIIYIITKIIFPLAILFIFHRNISDEKIIENFNNNIEIFEKAVEELADFEAIYLNKNGKNIEVSEHRERENNMVDIIQIAKEEFNNYENAIYLLENLNIEKILKYGNNTAFMFHSSMRGGQYVVMLNDREKYESSGYRINRIETIKDNWYYIECR